MNEQLTDDQPEDIGDEEHELPADAAILVVDDDEGIRFAICEFLETRGIHPKSASNGSEAIAMLEAEPFDIVILDLGMPVMGGLEVLRLMGEKKIHTVPVMLTAHGTAQNVAQAFKLGAYDYIAKPFNFDMLFNTIRNAWDRKMLAMENVHLRGVVSLLDVAEAVEDREGLTKLLQKVGEALLEESRADYVAIYLLNEARGEFQCRRSVSRQGPIDAGQLDETAVGSALTTGDILCDGQAGRALFTKLPDEEIYSFMAIPMKRSQDMTGFIAFLSFRPTELFATTQIRMFRVFCTYLAAAVENHRLYRDLMDSAAQTIQSLALAIEAKDRYTRGHSERVTSYAAAIARTMGLPEEELDSICCAGKLHDIGKISIDIDSLNKPGRLTPAEWIAFERHPMVGKKIIDPIKSLRDVAPLICYHHEHFDGKGYPTGISGSDIPLGSRIIAVADAFDAMTSDRPYRAALTREEALENLEKGAGTQFDPSVVEAFLTALESMAMSDKK